jgi:hypothetical protein
MIRQYMQTVLFESFRSALKEFTLFLLSFILRDSDARDSVVIEEIKYNTFIQLGLHHKTRNEGEESETPLVNDMELIKLQKGPMIKLNAKIEDFVNPDNGLKNYKIVTSPELEVISKDLF